jgi:hypothetical protein
MCGTAQNLNSRGRVSSATSLAGPVCFGTAGVGGIQVQADHRVEQAVQGARVPPGQVLQRSSR